VNCKFKGLYPFQQHFQLNNYDIIDSNAEFECLRGAVVSSPDSQLVDDY